MSDKESAKENKPQEHEPLGGRRGRSAGFLEKLILDEERAKGNCLDQELELTAKVEYVEEDKKKVIVLPQGFVPPRPRAHRVDPYVNRLPSSQVLKIDKGRSAWTNSRWKNDMSGVKAFLAAEYEQPNPSYQDPDIYNTYILPQQYNPAKDGDPEKLHSPDLVDVRHPRSLTNYGKKLAPPRTIPPWDGSPQNVVKKLLWRRASPLR